MEVRQAVIDDLFAVMTLMRDHANGDNPAWPRFLSKISTSSAMRAVEGLIKGGGVFVSTEDGVVDGTLVANIAFNSLTAQNIFNCIFVTPKNRGEMISAAAMKATDMKLPMAIALKDDAEEAAAELEALGFKCAARIYALE